MCRCQHYMDGAIQMHDDDGDAEKCISRHETRPGRHCMGRCGRCVTSKCARTTERDSEVDPDPDQPRLPVTHWRVKAT